MSKHHLKFKKIHPKVLRATELFFGETPEEGTPWRGTDEEKKVRYGTWLSMVSIVYGIDEPTLLVDQYDMELQQSVGMYNHDTRTISMSKWSVTTLFHEYRHHMQAMGLVPTIAIEDIEQREDDARGWACSLYYCVRPMLFRRAVREGKILYVHPRELARNPDQWVQPTCMRCEFRHDYVGRKLDCGHPSCRSCGTCLHPLCQGVVDDELTRRFNEIVEQGGGRIF